jgi:hypothetical protein
MAESEKPPTYSLTLKGEGISVSREVDQAVARSILEIVLGGDPEAAATGEHPKSPGVKGGRNRVSLREFLDGSEAKRMPDKIVTIGEYLISQAGQEDFTGDDVRERFRAAGEVPPANFGRDFKWTISNGWVAEDPKKAGHYYVTQTGKTAIQGKFSGEIKKKSGFKPLGRRRRKGAARFE